MGKTKMTGVRLDARTNERWEQIAKELGMNKNQAFEFLINSAEVVSKPKIKFRSKHLETASAPTKDKDQYIQQLIEKLIEYERHFAAQELRFAELENR